MNSLTIKNISKSFGNKKVISDLSFDVPEHSIFGFIGQNGAGKTTTMKIILGLLKADEGEVTVCGEKVNFGQTKTNRHIGYLPDVPEFYGYMRPNEYLNLCGEITGLSKEIIKKRGEELLSLVGLEGINKKIGGFSRGMKQRMGIAQALLNEPDLLICDEPTSALDPLGRKEILDIIKQVKGKTTVIFSTHILSDVERICDRIAVINKGKIAISGTVQELKSKNKADGLLIEFASAEDMERFSAIQGVSQYMPEAQKNGLCIKFRADDVKKIETAVIQALAQNVILPVRLEILKQTLENLFMEVVV